MLLSGFIFLLFKLTFGIVWLIADAKQPCFILKILGMRTTESLQYHFEMELHKNLTLSSLTRVLKEVPVPVWHIKIVQHENSSSNLSGSKAARSVSESPNPLQQKNPKVLYNATYKVCDFWKYVKRISVFSNVVQTVLSKDNTNMSFSCPLTVGTYVMRNIYVPSDTGFLKFMYWPQTIYTMYGTVYAQRADKTLIKKCSYEINGTVLKMCS